MRRTTPTVMTLALGLLVCWTVGGGCAVSGSGGSNHAFRPDAWVSLDAALPDAALPDAALPDAARVDAWAPTDARVGEDAKVPLADAALADAAVPDAVVSDAVVPDAAVPDAAVPDASVPTFGTLLYERVGNILVTGDLRRVRFHPSGAFALILATGGQVVRYDAATASLSLYATLGNAVADLDVAPDGTFFLVVGTGIDGVGRLWKISVDGSLALTHAEVALLSMGTPAAVEVRADGAVWAIGTRASVSLNYLYRYEDGSGVTGVSGFNSSGGLTDLMWGAPSLYAGSENVLLGCGDSGADSKTYVVDTDQVVANAWPGSFGNPGGAGWRPGGGFGMFTGRSSNKLYVYDGGWTMATLPGVGTAASPNAVGWKRDGTRALIVGRAIGNPLMATVIDYRPGLSSAFSASDLVNASIPGFNLTPWFGNSNTHLQGVDFRPGVACTEGLIVGSDNGTAFNPTYGLLVRFRDASDPDCAPLL